MEAYSPIEEILLSWRACMEIPLSTKHSPEAFVLANDSMKRIMVENGLLIAVFNRIISSYKCILNKNTLIILVDKNGIIIQETGGKNIKEHAKKSFIDIGLSFDQAVSGTNAIYLAHKLKRSVYTIPEHHYCDFLKQWYLFAIPLQVNRKIEGFLVAASFKKPINQDRALIASLLEYMVSNEFRQDRSKRSIMEEGEVTLTARQLDILRLLANGKTDMSVAIEMGLSIGTVRYHKTNIFKKLKVDCCTLAIIKALKLQLISLDSIDT
jgi:DNA-binding CsgD family transcriptional regulator